MSLNPFPVGTLPVTDESVAACRALSSAGAAPFASFVHAVIASALGRGASGGGDLSAHAAVTAGGGGADAAAAGSGRRHVGHVFASNSSHGRTHCGGGQVNACGCVERGGTSARMR